ncbi:MAG TPA: hypothetical protein PKY77_02515 [Phycisphaerae bacterium]|nr:hypothetical protein [Phycisphaerae bacterium]HRY66617.1 hypothetical protein [Phycisphaerae bacterium]HSA29074.1 hypothetical protein [Phycisphaerae bacterium]
MTPSSLCCRTVLLLVFTSAVPALAEPTVTWDAGQGRAVLTNGPLELTVETRPGLNPRSLRNVQNGIVYADRDYSWPGGAFPTPSGSPDISRSDDGSQSVTLKGRLGPLQIEQAFTAPANQPGVILENLTIGNATDNPVATADFKCGFAKLLRSGKTWSPDAEIRFCPIPYRRETNGQMQEFPLREVAEHGITYGGWAEPPTPTPIWGAEGWVWSHGPASFLLAKYNPDSMEWSLMEPEKRGTNTVLRFGGAGLWKHGHPESAARLEPGKSCRFGETRLQAVIGDWKHAFYAYRGYLEAKGCRTPSDYNPPIHWNELYDNEYYFKACELCDQRLKNHPPAEVFGPEFKQQTKKLLAQFYSLDLMKGEAAKASELGCESLYLDPGWDVGSSEQIWDADRLGPMASFVRMVRENYGLKAVSLWCSLAGVPPTYGDPNVCAPNARVLDKDGKPAHFLLCLSSPAFLDTKEQRLLEVCRNGVAFLMFDSNQFSGPCYDKTHGHQVPSTREDHARALLELTRRVKAKYPNVLIEMHDFITGPSGIHYTPSYYGYARPHSFDCLWGHEFMWNSMDDLLSRRAVSLYYYNLAYSIPLYLHVSLKPDNENALVLWWFASTCRHLGVGGKAGGPVWEAQKKAMQIYKPLKRFYTRGAFYGLDEMVHVHTLPDLGEAVVNAFNLDDKPVDRSIQFRPDEIGLPAGPIDVDGAPAQRDGNEVIVNVSIPARGHLLLKLRGRR